MQHIRKPFLLIVLLTGFGLSMMAQQKVELTDLSTKVRGPFTRFYFGVSSGKTEFEDYFTVSGGMIDLGLQAGQQVNSTLALYFNLNFMINPNPTFSNTSYSAESVGITELGGGFAIFTGKGKSYFSTDFNYAITTIASSSSSGSTNGGLGINIGAGYEYNLFGRVDLGIAVYYHYSTMKDKPSTFGEPQVTNNYYGARFTFRFGRR